MNYLERNKWFLRLFTRSQGFSPKRVFDDKSEGVSTIDVRMNKEIKIVINNWFKGQIIPMLVVCVIPVHSYFILVVNKGTRKGRGRLKIFFT